MLRTNYGRERVPRLRFLHQREHIFMPSQNETLKSQPVIDRGVARTQAHRTIERSLGRFPVEVVQQFDEPASAVSLREIAVEPQRAISSRSRLRHQRMRTASAVRHLHSIRKSKGGMCGSVLGVALNSQ